MEGQRSNICCSTLKNIFFYENIFGCNLLLKVILRRPLVSRFLLGVFKNWNPLIWSLMLGVHPWSSKRPSIVLTKYPDFWSHTEKTLFLKCSNWYYSCALSITSHMTLNTWPTRHYLSLDFLNGWVIESQLFIQSVRT